MLNHTNGFTIGLLTKNYFEVLQTFKNIIVNEINITEKNFILSSKCLNQQKILILDITFNLQNELTINECNKNKLLNINNTNYLFYKQNTDLKAISFCNHADQLHSTTISNNIINFNILLLNNNFYVFIENANNQLEVISLNLSFNKLRHDTYETSENFNIVSLNENNENIFMVGNFDQENQVITTSYGKTDFFVSEIKL